MSESDLGLVEWIKGQPAAAPAESEPVCPQCGSTMIQAVGQQKHCNSCGKDFDWDPNPIATCAQKRKQQRESSRA
jgi:tRNA(Ile2) C34 agmatinyltransferase TiaS